MTDDEKERIERMERNMEFIVEHQAQFAAEIQEMRAGMQEMRVGMQELRAGLQEVRQVLSSQNQAIVTVVGLVGRLAEIQEEFQKSAESRFAGLETRTADLEIKMKELAEAGKGTENRLNAFITFVEKYISSR